MTRKVSNAEIRRRAQQAREAAESATLDPQLESYLLQYRPTGLDEPTWSAICEPLQYIMRRSQIAGIARFAKCCTALTALLVFRHRRKLSLDPKDVLCELSIAQMLRTGRSGLSPKTLDDYASRLRGLASKVCPGPGALPHPDSWQHRTLKAPYSLAEVASIVDAVRFVRHPERRRGATFVVGAGLGAGLGATDFPTLVAGDVTVSDIGVRIAVHGSNPRVTFVRAEFEKMVIDSIEGLDDNAPVLGSKRVAVSDVLAPAISFSEVGIEAGRLRTTWLAWLLNQRLPLKLILDVAGLKSARSLTELVAFLDPIEIDPGLMRGVGQ